MPHTSARPLATAIPELRIHAEVPESQAGVSFFDIIESGSHVVYHLISKSDYDKLPRVLRPAGITDRAGVNVLTRVVVS
jgi:hypothetical protein